MKKSEINDWVHVIHTPQNTILNSEILFWKKNPIS